jgi:hypothetical protein
MKTAAEYAEIAEEYLTYRASDQANPALLAQVYATLAVAAATAEQNQSPLPCAMDGRSRSAMTDSEDWRDAAMTARRIIKALPDCLTKQALRDIDNYLAYELQDDLAAIEFQELVGWFPSEASRSPLPAPSLTEAEPGEKAEGTTPQPCPCGTEGCTTTNTFCYEHMRHCFPSDGRAAQ